MNIINDIREIIGNTPLLRLNRSEETDGVEIYAKLELLNPGGSVKDRIGIAMLRDAEEKGLLQKGGTIVEATAGNAGIGIALAALGKGYRVIFTVPEKFSIEKQQIMKAYGAQIVHTPKELGMQGAIAEQNKLLLEIPGAISLNQFTNPANPEIHYQTTGPEIYESLEGQLDYVVAGAGSGGTFSGILKYLKEKNPSIQGILADPVGSTMGGGDLEQCYSIEGIGNNFLPENMDMKLVDRVIKVNDEQAFSEVRRLAAREGLLVGSSSGAAIYAAKQIAGELGCTGDECARRMPNAPIRLVVILPDRGERYFSKNIYL